MDQITEKRYGKKIITRYRSCFQLLISVSHDIGEYRLSKKLMKPFLDRPVSCNGKWVAISKDRQDSTGRLRLEAI